MSFEYEYKISKGHHLVVIDGYTFIVDTGSPISFSFNGDIKNIKINGKLMSIGKNILGVDYHKVADLVDLDIDGFIGMDILLKFNNVVFDKANKKIYFDVENIVESLIIPIDIEKIIGQTAIFISLTVNGTKSKALFDTGAWIGYASDGLVAGSQSLGSVDDYAPTFGGRVITTKHEISLQSGLKNWTTIVGKMTEFIKLTCELINCSLVLGLNDFFGQCTIIDFKNKQIIIT